MEIKELSNEEVNYKDLKVGDCFIYVTTETVYMKLPRTLDEFKMPVNQAANLKNGLITHFKNLAPVIPVDATLNFKRHINSNESLVTSKGKYYNGYNKRRNR